MWELSVSATWWVLLHSPVACSVEDSSILCCWRPQQLLWQLQIPCSFQSGGHHSVHWHGSQQTALQRTLANLATKLTNSHCHHGSPWEGRCTAHPHRRKYCYNILGQGLPPQPLTGSIPQSYSCCTYTCTPDSGPEATLCAHISHTGTTTAMN